MTSTTAARRRQHSRFRLFVVAVVAFVGVALPNANGQASQRKTNVIYIVTDDQGYADVGFHGSKDIATPNLDALAASGVICTQGYVTFPVCSPSRAGLLTGRNGSRFGYYTNPDPKVPNVYTGLPTTEVTIADRLRAVGYTTGIVGKWHLGSKSPFQPLDRGFTEFFGFLYGGHRYWEWTADPKNQYLAEILRNRESVPAASSRYLTDLLSDEAVSFVDRHQKEPFFLYLAYNAPHSPLEASPEYLARVPNLQGKRKTYAAMILAIDDGVGKLRAKLRELNLEENTLVIFITDNGGPITDNGSINWPLRGQKSEVWEGGIRVPYVMSWKGTIPAGTRYKKPVSTLDFSPTALAAAGVDTTGLTAMEGVNLVPYFNGTLTDAPHDDLYWSHPLGKSWAVRMGDWKLVKDRKDKLGLFNIEQDISESNDLSAANPEIVQRLQKAWNRWNASNGSRLPWQVDGAVVSREPATPEKK